MFDISEKLTSKQNISRKKQRIFIVGASIATLVASGRDTSDLFSSGDVIGTPTSSDDIISFGSDGGVVGLGAGDDIAQGGDGVDTILGGAGADQINGGAGVDNLVVIGTIVNGEYSETDFVNVGGTGVDLSALLNIAYINGHTISDAQPGETIDGDADGAILYTFGAVDFTDVTLNNITKIFLDAEVIISNETLETLIIEGLTDILGDGTLKAETGQLDLDGVNVPTEVTILDAEGNIILPEFESTGSVSVEENTTSVGTFIVTDASAVGDVTYELSGSDASLFNINSATGEVEFISAPDYESVSGSFEIIITATDEHQKSVSQNVEITVSDVEEPSLGVAPEVILTGSEFLVNSDYSDNQFESKIAALNNGGFVITWVTSDPTGDGSGSAVKAQIYDETGAAVGSEFLVNSEYTASQYDTSISALNNGGFAIVWTTGNPADDGNDIAVKAQIFDAVGAKVGNEFLVNSQHEDGQDAPSITTLNNGNFVITWETYNAADDGSSAAVKAQIFNSSGTADGDEFLVNSQYTGGQEAPSITELDTGGFVITWVTYNTADDGDDSAVKAQIFDAAGTMVGSEFLVNSQYNDSQTKPTVTSLNYGGFVISWQTSDRSDDGSGTAIKAQIFNSTGTAVGSEFLVNSQHTGYQRVPSITALETGGFIVTWETNNAADDGSNAAIKAQIFSATGMMVGSEFLVNSQFTANQIDPSVTSLVDGGFVITWATSNAVDDGSGYAVKAQIYNFSETYNYNDGEASDFIINAALHPNHTSDTLGDVTISGVPDEATFNQGTNNGDGTWTISQAQIDGLQITFDGDYSGSINFGLSVTSITNGGVETTSSITIPLEVTDIAHALEFADSSVLAINVPENTTEVTTLTADDLDGDTLSYSLSGDDSALFNVDTDGVITFINEADYENPLDNGADNIYNITLNAADAEFSDTRDLVVTVSDVEEPSLNIAQEVLTTGVEFLVNSEYSGDQFNAEITALSNGGFVVTWTTSDATDDGSKAAIKAQIFSSTGVAVGSEFLVNSEYTENQFDPVISALNTGDFVIVWRTNNATDDGSGYALKAQMFDAVGATIGSEFLVNSQYADNQLKPSITALNNGGYAITWTDDSSTSDGSESAIKAQIFSSVGAPIGSEFLVNSQYTNAQFDPVITALDAGGFVIAWETYNSADDGSSSAIKAQIFDATGSMLGSEFLVNSQYADAQAIAAVTTLNNGNFIVSWETFNTADDGDETAIKAQIFNADGTPVGSDFLVNSQHTNYQFSPALAALDTGGFIITWETYNSADDGSFAAIKAQIFNADGTSVGSEFLVNSQHTNYQFTPSITTLENAGFVITWGTNNTADDGNGYAIKAQIYNFSEILNCNDGEATDFIISAELPSNHAGGTLSDVIISGVPDEATFTYVDGADATQILSAVGGELVLTTAQRNELKIEFDDGFNGTVEFTISVTSADSSGDDQLSTTITQTVSVGNSIVGTSASDALSATTGIDHVQLSGGIDSLEQAGDIADYTFKILGDDLQITDTSSSGANVDLLNSVETLIFNDGNLDVASLQTGGQITDMTESQYDFWLSHNFGYDVV